MSKKQEAQEQLVEELVAAESDYEIDLIDKKLAVLKKHQSKD